MRLKYIALTGLAALLFSGEAEGKRGKKAEEVSAAVVLPALKSGESKEVLSKAYHSRYAFLERDGKRKARDYAERVKNCSDGMENFSLCSTTRIGELEEAVKKGENELKELRRQYVEIMKQDSFSGGLIFLLTDYNAKCLLKRGKGNSSYCQELAEEILRRGTEKAKELDGDFSL